MAFLRLKSENGATVSSVGVASRDGSDQREVAERSGRTPCAPLVPRRAQPRDGHLQRVAPGRGPAAGGHRRRGERRDAGHPRPRRPAHPLGAGLDRRRRGRVPAGGVGGRSRRQRRPPGDPGRRERRRALAALEPVDRPGPRRSGRRPGGLRHPLAPSEPARAGPGGRRGGPTPAGSAGASPPTASRSTPPTGTRWRSPRTGAGG